MDHYYQLLLLLAIFLLIPYDCFCQNKAVRGLIEYNNLSYLEESKIENDSLQKLNLLVPDQFNNCPLLIWIGGGAWSYGDRNMEMDFAKKMGAQGIAVASVGHRLSPAIWRDSTLDTGIKHPKHMEDIASSTKWLYDHADMYGFDKKNIFIGGYSSGAHLASLITLDATYLAKHRLSTAIFKGVIPISGTYDINDYHTVFLSGNRPELAELHVEAVFGNNELALTQASPTNYLANLGIPMLLMCDNNLYNYTKLFEEKIRETNFRDVQVVYAYGLSHGELWRHLSHSDQSIYRTIIFEFIKSHSEI